MENNQQRNMVIMDGEVVDLYPPKSDKAPTVFTIKQTEEFNGNTRTNYISGKTFKHDSVRKGAIVHAIGSLRTNRWEDKDGNKHRDLEVIYNKIEETGFNGQAVAGEENQDRPLTQAEVVSEMDTVPTDIPEGEVNFDDIPF